MSAVGFRSGRFSRTDAGTLRNNWVLNVPDTLSNARWLLVPLNIVPPCSRLVPVREIMLKTRPPVDASAGPLPDRKLASSKAYGSR